MNPKPKPQVKKVVLAYSGGTFYTLVQKPNNMSNQEADRIIMDSIQKNIYGPWVFNITR